MRWPSLSAFSPARSTAVMCTNTSRPPSSGLMKPYPRSPLKNLTIPAIAIGSTPYPEGYFAAGPHGATARPDIHGGMESARYGLVTPPAPTGGGTSKPINLSVGQTRAVEKWRKLAFAGEPIQAVGPRFATQDARELRQEERKLVRKRPRRIDHDEAAAGQPAGLRERGHIHFHPQD